MKNYIMLIIGIATIVLLWMSYPILLSYFIPKIDERGQFGDMFGAISSLFSALAFLVAGYSIYLQREEGKISRYEFKFNHMLDIIRTQTSTINSQLSSFRFTNIVGGEDVELPLFESMNLYREYGNNERAKSFYINNNHLKIIELTTFIYDSNEFVYGLIITEKLKDDDATKLKKLYSRGLDRNIIVFLSLAVEALQIESAEEKSIYADINAAHEKLLNEQKRRLELVGEQLRY